MKSSVLRSICTFFGLLGLRLVVAVMLVIPIALIDLGLYAVFGLPCTSLIKLNIGFLVVTFGIPLIVTIIVAFIPPRKKLTKIVWNYFHCVISFYWELPVDLVKTIIESSCDAWYSTCENKELKLFPLFSGYRDTYGDCHFGFWWKVKYLFIELSTYSAAIGFLVYVFMAVPASK